MGRLASPGRLLPVLALLAGVAPALADPEPERLVVIMASDAPHPSLDRETLARIFLRKKTLWDNGEPVAPVNLAASHPMRRLFSQQVLGLTPEELDDYWNAQYFHGVFPPYVVASEEAMLRFVAQSPDAIGYVSACAADHRVKALFSVPAPPDKSTRTCPQK
jgi:ABC-type phosphate transport system substrate-binding protein